MGIMTLQIQNELQSMAREQTSMARNLEEMNQSLQERLLTGDHLIVSNNVNTAGDGATGGGAGTGNESETRKKKGVEDFEKEEDSVPDIQVTYKGFIL